MCVLDYFAQPLRWYFTTSWVLVINITLHNPPTLWRRKAGRKSEKIPLTSRQNDQEHDCEPATDAMQTSAKNHG